MLKNLVCLSGHDYTVVEFTSDYRSYNVFFIIADTEQKLLYCYTKAVLEEMFRRAKIQIEGISFSYLGGTVGKIYDWKNTLNNGILELNSRIKIRSINGVVPWNHLNILDSSYSVKQFYRGVYFYYNADVSVSQVSFDTNKPCLYLDSGHVNNDTIVETILKYPKTIKVSVQNYNNTELSLSNIDWSTIYLSNAFLNSKLQKINFGKLHLEDLNNLQHCFINCTQLNEIDFSGCVNDILENSNRTVDCFSLFNMATIANLATQQIIIYLNKDTPLFNKFIVGCNRSFHLIKGYVPLSEKDKYIKAKIGKELLMNKTLGNRNKIKGFIFLVDTKA